MKEINKKIKILGMELSSDHHLIKTGRSLSDGIDLVKCFANESFKKFSGIDEDKSAYECQPGESDDYKENRYWDYASSLTDTKGSKYIKITADNSVHCFIVASENDKKFKYGDVLKSASAKTPARNFARCNVIDDDVETIRKAIHWTGVNY